MKSIKKLEVRYNETDKMGVVYHANYVVWFDLARVQLVRDLGYEISELEKKGIMFPVISVDVKYLRSVRYGDKVEIHTHIKKMTKIKTTYEHKVYSNDELACVGTTVLVHADVESFRPISLEKFDKVMYDKCQELIQCD